VVFVLAVTACQLAGSCVVGYGFAKFKFKGSGVMFSLLLLTMMVPPLTIIVPQFLTMVNFNPFGIVGLFNSGKGINLNKGYLPLILFGLTGMGLKNSLYIYIFRQFFKNSPKELDEAAYIDGCGVIKTFFRIGVPLSKGAAVTVALFSIVWEWTDTFFIVFFGNRTKHLVSELINLRHMLWMNKADGSEIIYANAAMLLSLLPLLIMYLFFQKLFTQSVERSGIIG